MAHPKSRDRLCLTGRNSFDPILIEANALADPEDMETAIACVELVRAIGASTLLRPFVKREVMPGSLKGADLEDFIRNGATIYWHQTCTAKMGRDDRSVVDGRLKVYGVQNRRRVNPTPHYFCEYDGPLRDHRRASSREPTG
jgi:choline dehydrogenase